MAGKPIAVSFIADTRELNKGLANTQRALNDTGAEAAQAAEKVERVFVRVTDRADAAATNFSILGGAVGDVAGGFDAFGSALGLSEGQIEAINGASEKLSAALMFGAGVADIAAVSSELLNKVNLKGTAIKVKDRAVTIAKAAAEKAAAIGTKALAAAQWVLNAAMRANPIGILITALIAVGAALVLAYKKSETFRNIVNGVFAAVGVGVRAMLNVVRVVFNAMRKVIGTALGVIARIIRTYVAVYRRVFTVVWNAVKTVTKGAFTGIKNLVTTPLTAIVSFVRGVPGKLLALGSKFKNAGKSVIGKFIDGIGRVGGAAADFASKIWGAVKAAINSGIDKLNGLLEFDFKVKGIGFHVNPPDIPHLANGGITTGPTLALIGDNPGGREAVIPLDKYPLGGNTYNVTVVAPVGSSSADIGRELTKHIAAYERSGGRRRA